MLTEKLNALSEEIARVNVSVSRMKRGSRRLGSSSSSSRLRCPRKMLRRWLATRLRPLESQARKLLHAVQPSTSVVAVRLVPKAVAAAAEPPIDGEVKLRGKSVEMLRVCARMYPHGLTEAQVASQVGMKRTGGTWSDYKSLLRTSGCVRFDNSLMFATEEGMRRAGSDLPAAPSSTADVLAMWLPKLRGKSKDMLQALVANGGQAMSREELGAAVGVSTAGGTFSDYLSLLRTADLIVTDGSGVRANAETLLLR